MKNQMQKGFTLIELMIVVAIIGILAAIAIPQYQDYIARAQVSEACTLLGGLKTPIAEYAATNGAAPTLVSSSGDLDADDFTTSGTSVDSVAGATAGTYVATMKSSEVSNKVSGGKLNMVFTIADGQFSFADGGVTDKDLTAYAKCI
jgi:type IV pilus assembly protein PilA